MEVRSAIDRVIGAATVLGASGGTSWRLPSVHWRIEELVRKIDRCLHSVRTGGEYVDGLSVSQEENTLMDSVCHRTAALAPLRRWEGW